MLFHLPVFFILACYHSRYLSIFHQASLNSIDERFVTIITRTVIGSISLIMPLLVDISKSPPFFFLTNQNSNEGIKNQDRHFRFLVLFEVLLIIFVLLRVEIYKRSSEVPIQNNLEVIEPNNEDDDDDPTQESTIQFMILLLFSVILFVLIWLFLFRRSSGNILLDRIKITLIMQLIILNIIPSILIYRSPKMFNFFKETWKSLPKCRKTNAVDVVV